MSRLRALGSFAADFVVGDDPVIAVVVATAIGTTALLSSVGVAAWWLTPLAVGLVLAVSLRRARASRRP